MLDSAVFRPHTSFGETPKYPTAATAGAALFYALVLNHPFHNGNKRTAMVALLVFLDKNDYTLTLDQDALYDYVIRLADHRVIEGVPDLEYDSVADHESYAVARWLQGNIRRIRNREFCIKYRDLRRILTTYGCSFETIPGNRVNVFRAGRRVQIAHNGHDNNDVKPNTVHLLRRELQLDDEHGYDSDIFYNALPRIDAFIVKYRRLLDRLAKV